MLVTCAALCEYMGYKKLCCGIALSIAYKKCYRRERTNYHEFFLIVLGINVSDEPQNDNNPSLLYC